VLKSKSVVQDDKLLSMRADGVGWKMIFFGAGSARRPESLGESVKARRFI